MPVRSTNQGSSLASYPDYIKETYGIHATLCRLGFDSNDIYFGFQSIIGYKDQVVFLELRTQNKKCVFASLQVPNGSRQKIIEEWQSFCSALDTASDDELEQCYRRTNAGHHASTHMLSMVDVLLNKGFIVPKLTN